MKAKNIEKKKISKNFTWPSSIIKSQWCQDTQQNVPPSVSWGESDFCLFEKKGFEGLKNSGGMNLLGGGQEGCRLLWLEVQEDAVGSLTSNWVMLFQH